MASVFKRGGKRAKGDYYVSWSDHNSVRQTKSTRTTDKATAERIAKKLEADAALRREGVIDAELDAISKESQRSIESHLTDYLNKLRAADRHPRYIRDLTTVIHSIAEFGNLKAVADINADIVNRYVGSLRDLDRAAATISYHLAAIKGFTQWLVENHKLPRNPLASIQKPNAKADQRLERRALLHEEWPWLEAVTANGGESYGMAGRERVLLYNVAIQTGLRSNELRSLTRGRLFLDYSAPCITCKARSTKNKKDARQYIQPELAAELKAHIATKSPKAPVFAFPHETDLARMMRYDLAEARKAWLQDAVRDPDEHLQREQSDFLTAMNHEGESFDFHALRHTCGAWLSLAGVHPKVVQTVMRHSTITLTMDTYGHLFPGQEADAVARLSNVFNGPPMPLKATGTDGRAVDAFDKAQRIAQRAGRETTPDGASECDEPSVGSAQKKSPKSHQSEDLGDAVRDDATDDESRAGRTRTYNQQIMSLLL